MNNIEEIEVNVKTYKTYSHLKDIQFIGQRDCSFLDTIWVGDLLENPFKDLDEYTYEFITEAYNYHPIYEQRENEGYYVKNWQGQGITANQKTYDKTHETNHDHHIRTDLTDEEKNRVYSIIIGMIDKFKGDEKNKQSIKYKLNHSNIIRPSKDGIKKIQKGRYLDIFRRTSEGTVLLRAEYYFDGKNWCEVNIKNLQCNRKIDYSSASKTISVPANQIIYLMLSDIEQAPQRLEALRTKLEKQAPKDWAGLNDFINSPRKIISPVVETKQEPYFTMSKGSIYDNRLRALEYPKINIDLKTKLEKNPCMIGYENIIYEDNDTPTLIVPDFAEYAENLFESLAKSYHIYITKTGADLSLNEDYINQPIVDNDKKIKEKDENKIKNQNEHNTQLLKYLSELVCDKNNKWNLLNKEKGYDLSMKRELFNIRSEFSKVNYLAKKLSWWICQSPYQDLLYDYEFYYEYTKKDASLFDEYMDKHFIQNLEILGNITIANEALLYFYDDFEIKTRSLFAKKNKELGDKFYSAYEKYKVDDEIPEDDDDTKIIKDDFTLLETYESIQEPNWLVQIAYPRIKTVTKKGYLKTIGVLSHIVVIRDGKKYQVEQLPRLFRKFMKNCTSEEIKLSCISLNNKYAQIGLTNKRKKTINFLYCNDAPKDNIVENIKKSNFTNLIKYTVSAIDKAIMIYNLAYSEDGNDYIKLLDSVAEDLIQLSKFNDSIKKTWLGKIKINGKAFFKDWAGVISVAASVATLFYYIHEGDAEYAITNFVSDIIILAITCAFGGLYLTVAMIFIKMVIDSLLKQLKTDSFEKWVSLNNYGCDHKLLTEPEKFPNKWKNNIYPKFVQDLTHTKDEINKNTRQWYNSTKEQIRTYYRILTPIKVDAVLYQRYSNQQISDAYTREVNGSKSSFKQYYTLCIELSMNNFYPGDKFIIYFNNTYTKEKDSRKPKEQICITKENINHVITKDGKNKFLLIVQGDNRKHNERIMEDIVRIYRRFRTEDEMKTIMAPKIIESMVSICDKNVWTRYIEISIEYYSSFYNSIDINEPVTTVQSNFMLINDISNVGV